jgi:hypothetical protein
MAKIWIWRAMTRRADFDDSDTVFGFSDEVTSYCSFGITLVLGIDMIVFIHYLAIYNVQKMIQN